MAQYLIGDEVDRPLKDDRDRPSAASCRARALAYIIDRSRTLSSVRLASNHPHQVLQRSLGHHGSAREKIGFPTYVFSRGLITYGVSLLVLLAAVPVMAELLSDPTRPPGEAGEIGLEAEAAGPVLQSVILGPGRKSAVINGQVVALGQRVGDHVLVQVNERAVVLQNPQGERTSLELHPAVTKVLSVKKPEKKIAAKKTKSSDNRQASGNR